MTNLPPENRLAREASPYLRQHARNPVDWYPWGPEALEEARAKDKPILLSIGYSACHWCHVMERESFEDAAIARQMNELFVNIKVDREERPDLDHIYQLVVQLLGRSGGWPLTVFLTPQQKPFFGGTYFPPVDRYGVPGFPKVLAAIAAAYREQREEVASQADEIASAIAGATAGEATGSAAALTPAALQAAAKKLVARFDDQHGGFGSRPKFPSTMALALLLEDAWTTRDEANLGRVRLALEAMRGGGIYDHLGGGFHRYSTDEKWLVPHFEKMLYDNALLLRLYADGHRAFEADAFAATVVDIARYLRREMTDASGAFYATQDADSEGEEGRFFVWSPEELQAVLGGDPEALAVALAHYGVTPEGNFEETGKTVLAEAEPIASLAVRMGKAPSHLTRALERARTALFEARRSRVAPFRDEKILASWNGLAIGALAYGGRAVGDAELIATARRAFDAVETHLLRTATLDGEPSLRAARLVKDGVVKEHGFLDDHAYLACASLDLYEATGEPRYVEVAAALARTVLARFHDPKGGGFFFTADDAEALIVRAKDPYDQAVPSGAAMACQALRRLGVLLGEPFASVAQREVERLGEAALKNPFGMAQLALEVGPLVRGSVDVLLVGPRDDARTEALAAEAFARYVPGRLVAWFDPADARSRAACAALAEGKEPRAEPVAYVCRGRTCSPPVSRPEDLRPLLG